MTLRNLLGDQSYEIRENYDFFLQEKGHHVWGHNVPKFYGASSTRNSQKNHTITREFCSLIEDTV